ncbi:hypothetical protein BX600DRAFT_231842 [Xylariales sp. PMI_506]|nr:hypothetical protein BX600DRAFT_231842 [Xylariales sp. PMI_506]
MKSSVIAIAVLASSAIAQPHGHHRRHHQHDKRDVVVEWVTEWETATVIIEDHTTETILPTPTPAVATSQGGNFFQSDSNSAAAPTTTSVAETVEAVQPTPTTTSTSTPAAVYTTSEAAASPTTTSTTAAAAATSSSSSSSGSSTGANVKTGQMTYYTPGLGSCGYDDSGAGASGNVVAVDIAFFQSVSSLTSYGLNEPANPLCDQEITISVNGATTTGVIRDSCPSCGTDGIDVTEFIFDTLMGSTTDGHVEVEWWFNSGKY